MYLKQLQRKTKTLYVLHHFPNGLRGWGQARPKLGARSVIQVSRVRSRDLSTWAIFYCFLQGASLAVEQPGRRAVLM